MPHFPARIIDSKKTLESWMGQYSDKANVQEALLIAGGANKPVGEFDSSIQLIETEFFDKFLLKVREDNHLVFELIQVVKKIAEESGNPVIAESYMKGICTVYKLIESQMESEEMNLFWGD